VEHSPDASAEENVHESMIANESDTTGSEQLMDSTKDVKESADSDTLEAEVVETSNGNSLFADSEENLETETSVAPELDDFDAES
ncbi:MAG: hypothetical protein OXD49_12145, partial [Candidatus Poribacteria bacterium]|nr:hypothetical protein [Candidatus Poribacteria bacterium]